MTGIVAVQTKKKGKNKEDEQHNFIEQNNIRACVHIEICFIGCT